MQKIRLTKKCWENDKNDPNTDWDRVYENYAKDQVFTVRVDYPDDEYYFIPLSLEQQAEFAKYGFSHGNSLLFTCFYWPIDCAEIVSGN